jgi:hypothetical protein
MRKIFSIASLFLAFIMVAPRLSAGQQEFATARWSVSAADNLASKPPPDKSILGLINALLPAGIYTGVCSARFVNLQHSRNLSLVACLSDGQFCYVYIVDKTRAGFQVHSLDLAHFSRDVQVEDLSGNGNLELVAPTEFAGWQGRLTRTCVATWPVIYAWTDNGYSDVSSQYRGFYEKKLASLKQQIAADDAAAEAPQAPEPAAMPTRAPVYLEQMQVRSGSGQPSSGPAEAGPLRSYVPSPAASPSPAVAADLANADCTRAEAAKIERFLGIDSEAGMKDAIRWADSDKPCWREFATEILRDIGTADATEYLRTLSHDSNPLVARYAQNALKAIARGPVAHTVDREKVEQPAGSPLR